MDYSPDGTGDGWARGGAWSPDVPRHGLALLSFALFGLLLYGHTLHAPFYLDDVANLRDHLPRLQSFAPRDMLDTAFGGLLGRRPLANLSFALNVRLHDMAVPGYHMVNIGIHIAAGILLYWFLYKTLTLADRLGKVRNASFTALAASLIWFVHPLQTQAVTYIVQRMTSMAAFFSLAAFLAYIYGRSTRPGKERAFLFVLAMVLWVLAMASKEIALAVPALVFLYEWFFFQDLNATWLKKWAAVALAGIVGLLLCAYWLYGYTPVTFLTLVEQPRGYTAMERLLTEGRVVFLYLGLLAFPYPARLTLDHHVPISRGLTEPMTTLFALLGLLAIGATTCLLVKRHRLAAFSVLWFFANLSLEALAASIEPMFEHRVYAPSMLLFLPLVLVAPSLVPTKAVRISALVTGLSVLSLWTYQRNSLWNDPVAFWEDGAQKAPGHFRPHFQLGTSYLNRGDLDGALNAFHQALALNPPYPTEILTNIGLSYYRKGDPVLARRSLDRALTLNPANYVAHDLLGTLDREASDHGAAEKRYRRAMALNPHAVDSRYNLGLLHLEKGALVEATRMFEQVTAMRPLWGPGYHSLGLALAAQGRLPQAVTALEKAVSLDGTDLDALFNLATAYSQVGRHDSAALTYEKVLAIQPEDVETLHNLGLIYLHHLRDPSRARDCFQRTLSINPQYDHAEIARGVLSQVHVVPSNQTGSLLEQGRTTP